MNKDNSLKIIELDKIKETVKMVYQNRERVIDLTCTYDIDGFTNEQVIEWYRLNHLGRRLDEKAAMYLKMAKGWSYHAPFGGHDGIQLALGRIYRAGKDFLFPYYRDLMTCLAAGITVEEIILNGLSKDTDVAGGGRHMSNHFAKQSINIQNVSSCTGNHSQQVTGLARAVRKYKDDAVVYYSSGESACSEGYFWEALNVASLEKLPAVFVVQNNKYGISVPVTEQTANTRISDNYIGFNNFKIFNCDGRNPFDSYKALSNAQQYVVSGQGAAMVHADCDRISSHSNSDPQTLYRSSEEIESVGRRDPLMQFRYFILKNNFINEEDLIKLERENQEIIFAAADKAEAAPNADGRTYNQFIVPPSYVKIEDNTETPVNTDAPTISYLHSINNTLKEEFRLNPNTYLWGQDVASKDKGGVFNVCKGMLQEFGNDRIFNSPIAEDNIVGTANGFSRYRKDIRVVIEGAEFADYFWPAMEQLLECSHDYWRTKGQFSPNIVIRLASGGYIQGGIYHSQNLEATFTTIPGLRVVNPAFADDAAGLLRNAIRSEGVTLFLEPKFLYNFKGASTPTPDDKFIVPFGKAKVRRLGKDVTVISYGTAVHLSLAAATELDKEGISVEVIDLRSLSPWDKTTVINSVKKTGKVLIAHEDRVNGGFGGEVSATIADEAFNYLDAPVLRTGSKDCPVGFAKSYETEILLNVKDIKEKILRLYSY